MKKLTILLLIFTAFSMNAQDYFSTTTSTAGSTDDITHYGTVVIGDLNQGYIPNPWLSYNDILLRLNNKNLNTSLEVRNNYGKFNLSVASVNGAYSPIAEQGDIVFTKNTAKHIIFNLNNSENDGNSAFFFGDSMNTKTLSILNNGKVGIGTGTPDAELAVNGTVHARKVLVDLVGWPDFVFETGYNLPSLKEVEKHIQEKGHLQNIPSAKQVEDNGVELGEMSSKLLQKIEELTLYTIQQQKLIDQLQKDLKELQAKSK
jgi:hypothetical protein